MVLVLTRPDSGLAQPITDYERARQLVHAYGSDTLAYFALRNDKRYFFSSDGDAMIAYALIGNYALASGDPIGHPESIGPVVDEFVAMCRDRRWRCAFLAVRESDKFRYTDLGLRSFYLGEEAVIECEDFSLAGKRNKSMRQSVHRVERTHRFEIMAESDASPALAKQLNDLSCKWRGRAPERGFTMALSQAVEGVNPDYRLCVAFDEHGVPGGFLRMVPLFGGERGMTLDMMRRDPASPNGMTEFLIANTAFALREQGIRQLSMNFAVMGRLFSADPALTPRDRLLKAIVSLGNPYFQIKSLHDFSRRFRPTWRPRVIAYEGSLTRIAILYSGLEGHLALPLIGRYFVPPRFDHDTGTARIRTTVRTAPPLSNVNGSVAEDCTLCSSGGLFYIADEAVEVLEPHDMRAVAVDVEQGVGDPLGDEFGVGRGDEPILGAVGHERRHVDAGERVVDARIGGEGLLGGVLAPVDGLGELEGVVGADGGDLDHLLHVGVALSGAGGGEGQVEDLVEVPGAVGGVRGPVGLDGRRPAGRRAGQHQRAGRTRVARGEGQGDLAAGGPADDGRAGDAERVDERRQVVGHLADGERRGRRVGAVADAAQVVHRDLVVRGEPARKVGAPHRHRAALPDDQDHRWAGADLAVPDGDAVGLHLPHRAEEGEVAAGLGAGDLGADDGSRLDRDRGHAIVLGRGGRGEEAGARCVDRASGSGRGDEGQKGYKRNQTW
jgi:hypothetical protein